MNSYDAKSIQYALRAGRRRKSWYSSKFLWYPGKRNEKPWYLSIIPFVLINFLGYVCIYTCTIQQAEQTLKFWGGVNVDHVIMATHSFP